MTNSPDAERRAIDALTDEAALKAEAAEWQFEARLQTEYYDWRIRMGLEPLLTHLELIARCEMIAKEPGCLTDEKWCRVYCYEAPTLLIDDRR